MLLNTTKWKFLYKCKVLQRSQNINISYLLTIISELIYIFVTEETGDCRNPYHSSSKACPAAVACPMEDITMKRKPKMHNEHEFDIDNIYQEDERQLDIMDDRPFDITYK